MDTGLVVRAKQGDAHAFNQLAVHLYPRLHRIAASIVGDAQVAQDATQQAMLDVWRKLPQLRDPSRFEAWCYRALTNACRSEGRRRQRWGRDASGPWAVEPAIPDATRVVEQRDLLQRGFERLSVEHRTILVLRYYADMTQEQVGEVLDLPIGTVRSRLSRAIRSLQAALDAEARVAPHLSGSQEAVR